MRKTQWIEEVAYCAKLVETSGNSSVPADRVKSYLEMQAETAEREGFKDVANEITMLAIDWLGG